MWPAPTTLALRLGKWGVGANTNKLRGLNPDPKSYRGEKEVPKNPESSEFPKPTCRPAIPCPRVIHGDARTRPNRCRVEGEQLESFKDFRIENGSKHG